MLVVGETDGEADGERVLSVGAGLGIGVVGGIPGVLSLVGTGAELGDIVGLLEGDEVGLCVVGKAVGLAVGAAVQGTQRPHTNASS
mmetsp:Transcript_6912/g.17684  ORF Transcript_6912/g.17684 Transcript_6912/m.17684 type:complete len:86 (-) Transcript_6912:627-884(-)